MTLENWEQIADEITEAARLRGSAAADLAVSRLAFEALVERVGGIRAFVLGSQGGVKQYMGLRLVRDETLAPGAWEIRARGEDEVLKAEIADEFVGNCGGIRCEHCGSVRLTTAWCHCPAGQEAEREYTDWAKRLDGKEEVPSISSDRSHAADAMLLAPQWWGDQPKPVRFDPMAYVTDNYACVRCGDQANHWIRRDGGIDFLCQKHAQAISKPKRLSPFSDNAAPRITEAGMAAKWGGEDG